MEQRARILIADDEAAIADLVAQVLADEGFAAHAVYSGEAALVAFRERAFDLVILDVMMPGIDGFEACRRLRSESDVPIMFLTAKDEEIDQVVGLSLGADDYVVKPFLPRVLAARVKARLRSRERASRARAHVLESGGIVLDEDAHEALLHDVPLRLTPKEFGILAELMRAHGNPVSAKDLFEAVWREPYTASSGNSVMVHIRHVREKLAAIDASQEFVSTVWGVGYRMVGSRGRKGA